MTRTEWIDAIGGALTFAALFVGLPFALLAFGII